MPKNPSSGTTFVHRDLAACSDSALTEAYAQVIGAYGDDAQVSQLCATRGIAWALCAVVMELRAAREAGVLEGI